MIPAGPGLAGNYELFTLKALALFVAPEAVASAGAAMVASMHVIQFVVQVVPGVMLAGLGASGMFSLRHAAAQAQAEGEQT